jgi:hypothetical protein
MALRRDRFVRQGALDIMRILTILGLVSVLAGGIACSKKDDEPGSSATSGAEKTGKDVDKAVDEAGDKVDEAAEDVGDKVEETGK